MNPNDAKPRRRPQAMPCAESLEGRALLTGGAGNTFALVPGTVAAVNGTTALKFTIDPARSFVLPNRKVALGIDVAPTDGSTVNPLIASVDNQHDGIVPQTFHSIRNPHLPRQAVARGAGTGAVITPVVTWPSDPTKPINETVNISAQNRTSGNFLVGFYLPGDANGDGQVDQADIQAVKQALGSKVGSSRYNFDADANRDGRVAKIDLTYTKQNLGVRTNITPVVSANLDPASDTGARDRITTSTTAHFTGGTSPGASVTFTEIAGKVPSVTAVADAAGNYSAVVPLAPGSNTFNLTSIDPFGQTISGKLTPITRGEEPSVKINL